MSRTHGRPARRTPLHPFGALLVLVAAVLVAWRASPADAATTAGAPPGGRPSLVVGAGGVPISVTEYGPDAAPTVVLVHGWPDNAGVWNGVVPALATRYHVVNYDPRGSGPSGHPRRARDYALALLSRDFEAVIDATAPGRRVHVLAHDWGAVQTWESASRIPERIATFTFISGPSLDLSSQAIRHQLTRPAAWPALLAQLGASSYIGFNYLPDLPEALWKSGAGNALFDGIARLTEGAERGPYDPRDGAAQTNLYRANILQRFARPTYNHVDVPLVQQLVPARDLFVGPVFYDGLAGRVPSLWRRTVPGGHWVVLTQPALVAQATAEAIEFSERGAAPPPGVVVK